MIVAIRSVARCLALVVLVQAGVVFADEWPQPTVREMFSESRDHFVRVIPGKSWGDTFGFAGSKKGEYAKAEFYHRQKDGSYAKGAEAELANPVAPVEFFVGEDGHLITVDNWHNMGYGKVLVLYGPDGSRIKGYDLADLFSKDEIDRLDHSASSIWWHKGPVYIKTGQRYFFVSIDEKGGSMDVDLHTGDFQYCEWHPKDFLCRSSNADRTWQPYREPR